MKKSLTLSEIAVGIFVFILVATFALQFASNRRAGGKVLAQSAVIANPFNCPLDGETYDYDLRLIQTCTTPNATTTFADGRQYSCASNCLWVPINVGIGTPDSPVCCVGNPRFGISRKDPSKSQAACPNATPEEIAAMKSKADERPLKWFPSESAFESEMISRGGVCAPRPPSQCGNSVLEGGEQCENGIACKNGSECIVDTCKCKVSATCGNDKTELPEECDAGPGNSNSPNACRLNCTKPVCGDAIVDDKGPYNEKCDLGSENGQPGVACTSTCTLVVATTPTTTYVVTTPLVLLSNPLYVMKTVMQWNLMTVLTPFVNLQNFLFPQDMWSKILGQ